jgi:uroporphyrinogen decarboxylase
LLSFAEIEHFRRNNTPDNLKDEIKSVVKGESSFIPVVYKMLGDETLNLKGEALLELIKRYPDHIIRLDPYPSDLGYRTEEEIAQNGVKIPGKDSVWLDEWGVKWRHTVNSVGSSVIEYPIKDCEQIEEYIQNKLPGGSLPSRLSKAKGEIEKIDQSNKKYLVGKMILGIFERVCTLMGMDNFFIDIYLNKNITLSLIRELTNFHLSLIEEWAKLEVDAIHLSDDWGGQDNILISPDYWRDVFKPYYRELFSCAHCHNLDVFFHSCGAVEKIIGDLVEIGADVIHPLQPVPGNNYRNIASEYGSDLTVMGGIDVQNALTGLDSSELIRSIYSFVEVFSKYNCGIILSPTNNIVPDTPMENIRVAFETMDKISRESSG